MRENGTLYFLLADHLGSTSITANGSGVKVAELRYKAWGETRYTWGTTPTTYRYTGQREDSYINMYYMGARWYDPSLARFTQPDTIVPKPGDPQNWNRFGYVKNNPAKYNDPSGHCIPGENCPGDSEDEPYIQKDPHIWTAYEQWNPQRPERKYIEVHVSVPSGEDTADYVLVQFVMGSMTDLDTGDPVSIDDWHGDHDEPANWPNWEIDSVDADPAYWSDSSARWNYNPGVSAGEFWAYDIPGSTRPAYRQNLSFATCVYKTSDVPRDADSANVADLMKASLGCVYWGVNSQRYASGRVTHTYP